MNRAKAAYCFAGVSALTDIVAELLFWGWVFPTIDLPGSLRAYIRYLGYLPHVMAACAVAGLVLAVVSELLNRTAPEPEKIRRRDYMIPALLVFNIMQPVIMVLAFSVGVMSSP